MLINKRFVGRYRMVLGVLGIALCAASCKKDFLDQKTLSVITEQTVFSDSLYSQQFVNGRYVNISNSYDVNRFGHGGVEAACDEAEAGRSPTEQHNLINSGAQNPSNVDKGIWTSTYAQVRAVNLFLKNKATIPVSEDTRNRWEGEVRFLRAWYYFTMLKHFGGFPNVGNTIYEQGQVINVPRSTYEACVNYIVAECDTAFKLLPLNYLNGSGVGTADYGRATQGAALGLKARVLLYAASPLANGPRADDPGHLVSYTGADNNRWKLAADAAKAVIGLNQYSLYVASTPAFYQTFLQWQNAEQVFAYYPPTSTPNNMFRETVCNPPSRGTRYQVDVNCFPLQELVDAFGMQSGLPITDPAAGYAVGDNMYKNRDPRFYASISYNGSLRALNGYTGDQPVYTYTGVVPTGNSSATSALIDGIYKNNATKTGYYAYKMLSNTVINGGSELNRPRMLIRYAEILLNAAEATNEFEGATSDVYTWLRAIRNRAGITAGTTNLYGIKDNMTKDDMRAFIQNERQVELAYEEHRFWDIRRWKIAPQTENKEMHGMEITRAADGSYSYRLIVVRKHVFTEKMYFWPIPQSELTKSPALKQNPGY
jgi:hypothetical protein